LTGAVTYTEDCPAPFRPNRVVQANRPSAARLNSVTLGIAGQAVQYSIKVSACRRELNSHEAASPQSHPRFARTPRRREADPVSATATTQFARGHLVLAASRNLQGLCQVAVPSVEATPLGPKSLHVHSVCGLNVIVGSVIASKPTGKANHIASGAHVQGRCTWSRSRLVPSGPRALPNSSVNATANGMALGPRSTQAYHVLRGPSTMPSSARYLKRWAPRHATLPSTC
jgi:hypothetical protein